MPKIPASLYLIHMMVMFSPAIFALVVHFVALPGEAKNPTTTQETLVFQTVAAVLTIIGVATSQLVPRFMARGKTQMLMRQYTTMKIVQWALLEGSAIFIGIIFYITGQRNMLIPMGILIALLAFMRPTVDELMRFNFKD